MSDEEVVDNVQIDPAIESEARQLGWVPKEEFRGDDSRWIEADRFVERGREILPILKKNKEELLRKNATLENEIKEMRTTFDEFKEYRKADQDKMYKQALADLKQQKKTAIEEGDGEKVIQLEDEMDTLKESQIVMEKAPTKKEPPAVDPVFAEWSESNGWFNKDAALQHAANAAGVDIANDAFLNGTEVLKGRAFLDEVSKRVKERYPEKFGKRQAPVMEDGAPTRATNKKQSYANLPPEAKASCDKFVKAGLVTQEQYLKDYEWES